MFSNLHMSKNVQSGTGVVRGLKILRRNVDSKCFCYVPNRWETPNPRERGILVYCFVYYFAWGLYFILVLSCLWRVNISNYWNVLFEINTLVDIYLDFICFTYVCNYWKIMTKYNTHWLAFELKFLMKFVLPNLIEFIIS